MGTKELHFFDEERYETAGWSWYSEHFQRLEGVKAYGEWTPEYLFNNVAFERMSRDLCDVKILALFRNPVDRAYSTYWRYRASGFTNLGFAEALRKYKFFQERSRYYEAWQRFRGRFGTQNCLPLIFEHLRDNPEDVFRKVFRFLGVDQEFKPNTERVRRNTLRFNRSQRATDILTSAKQKLRERNLGFLVNGARRIGLRHFFAAVNTTRSGYPQELSAGERELVSSRYFDDDINLFSSLIDQDLSVWCNASGTLIRN